MKQKNMIWGVLAILCIFWMGGYGLKLYGEYFDRKQEWNEAAKVSFEDALWMEVDNNGQPENLVYVSNIYTFAL